MNSSFAIRMLGIDGPSEGSQTRAAPSSIERPTASVETADEVLMARVVDGDKEALAGLFRRYARLVRSIGYKILRDDSEADDLLQDVFLFIHQKSAAFDGSRSSARSWIVAMAYQRAIDRPAAIWFPAISIPRSIWKMSEMN
jgi:hypothetical protein